ncbi:PQQ-binding-like beta-propeller repeat protein [Haloarcula onubensis]|uniref:PQQ-binding-like beta-propeller repeat protein n=1 Tax=Haloarcula onubensis TaxID=2950539 RepID=A0ABU2FKZ0_9EURY|nr:PQQ-binding-like beta-propeller repeat protein [Halomicroarcula sp. S3CR25-11]MDS0280982.1 PQQ-binding-like beta-propeller repeat protein [Halomicroarcula sp. S3CR25-11]
MDSRRRSYLAAAGSVVTGILAGCPGFLRPSDGPSGRNRTGTGVDGASLQLPETVENAYPQYQYDAANTGTVPDVSGPTGAVTSLFEFGRAGFTPSHRMGSPSLRDGRLYLTEGRIDGAGDGETFVYALDAVDGSRQWATMYRGTNAAGPTAVTDDLVLATVGEELVGLAATTGVEQWSFDRGVQSGITVDGDTVYVVGRADGSATLYSLSAADGSLDWQTPVDADTAPVTPAVADGTVYTGGNTLQAFDAATGETEWTADCIVTAPATVTGERVVVGSGTAVRVFDRADGTEQWSNGVETYGNQESPAVTNPPAVTDDTIYAVADRGLTALSLTGSQHRYTVEIGIDGTPVVADGFIYLFGRGQLTCRAAADGRTEWTYGTRQRTSPGGAAPVVGDNVAFFPAERLYAIAG